MRLQLAKVLLTYGDLALAKEQAEGSVKVLVPLQKGVKDEDDTAAIDALLVLATAYEQISVKLYELQNLKEEDKRQEIIKKALTCYDAYLQHYNWSDSDAYPPGLSRPGKIAESILRLKVLQMSEVALLELIEGVEDLIISASTHQAMGDKAQVRGVKNLLPRAVGRSVAETALCTNVGGALPERLERLFENVAGEAVMKGIRISQWFDEQCRVMSEGFSLYWTPGDKDPGYKATVDLLDIVRFFGGGKNLYRTIKERHLHWQLYHEQLHHQ